MKIGGEDRPDWVIERRWQAFSKEIGIAYKLVRQRLVYLKEAVLDAAMQLMHEEHIKNNSCEVYDRIIAIIRRRSTKITNSLNAAQDEATAQ
jgi:serine/threonine-protein kinase HipA